METKMLNGKIAIITGSGKGMGQTMAELFAQEGAFVVLTDIDGISLNKAVKGQVLQVCDGAFL